MKRILISSLVLILGISILFTGCGDAGYDSEITSALDTNKASLTDTFTGESSSFALLSDYLKSWGKKSSLDVIDVSDNYIVISNPATEGQKKVSTKVLVCSIDTSDIQSDLSLLATAMTALSATNEHGEIRLIVAESTNGVYSGIKSLPKKYINGNEVITLRTSSSDLILTSGAESSSCVFSTSSDTEESLHTEAYEIKMSMTEYADPYNFSKESNYPNPISVIGNLLATEKSSGKLFDIASFSYEGNEGYLPYSATAVVVIDSNNVDSFMKKFDKSFDNMTDKFDTLDDDFVYTVTETDVPDEVLSEDVSNNLISLMYTLNTGICIQDEDTGIVQAASYIDSISTKNGNLKMKINIKSRNETALDDLCTEYETTAGLCSAKFYENKKGETWTSDAESKLVTYFTEKVPLDSSEDSEIAIKSCENDIIASTYPNMNMIVYSFKSNSCETALLNLCHYLDPEYEDESDDSGNAE